MQKKAAEHEGVPKFIFNIKEKVWKYYVILEIIQEGGKWTVCLLRCRDRKLHIICPNFSK